MVRKNEFSIAALFKLVVLAQASVGRPITADWVFGRGALDSMRKLIHFLSIKAYKPDPVVTQNKMMKLKMSMSPLKT